MPIAVSGWCQLSKLNIGANDFGDVGLQKLAKALWAMPSTRLEALYVGNQKQLKRLPDTPVGEDSYSVIGCNAISEACTAKFIELWV